MNQHSRNLPSTTSKEPHTIIGREGDLRYLLDVLSSTLKDNRSQFVLITGKSYLVHAFTHWISRLPDSVTLAQADMEPQQVVRPYHLWRSLITHTHSIHETDSPATVLHKLEAMVATYNATDPENQSALIGHLLGFDFTSLPVIQATQHDPRQLQLQGQNALMDYLQAWSQVQPLVLILEDLHWTDVASRTFLTQVVKNHVTLPIVYVATARTGLLTLTDLKLDQQEQVHCLELSPLKAHTSRQVIDSIVPNKQLPDAVYQDIIARSEGNPLYLTSFGHMVRTIPNTTTIRNQFTASPVDGSHPSLPTTLTAVLNERFAQLSPFTQEILQVAAVLGPTFQLDTLMEFLNQRTDPKPADGDQTQTDITTALHTLQQHAWIKPGMGNLITQKPTYHFHHALLQEAVYAQIADNERSSHHRRIAYQLINEFGERTEEYAHLIADHFAHGQCPVEAAEWYTHAGNHALARYATTESIQLFRHALTLLPKDDHYRAKQFTLYDRLGKALVRQMAYTEAQRTYERMYSEATQHGEIQIQVQALLGLAVVHEKQAAPHEMLQVAQQAADLLQPQGASALMVRAFVNQAQAYYLLGHKSAAVPIAQHAYTLSQQLQLGQETIDALNVMAIAYIGLGQFQHAEDTFQRCLVRCQAAGDQAREVIILHNLAYLAMQQGAYEQAITLANTSLQIAQALHLRSSVIFYHMTLGEASLRLGSIDAALSSLQQGYELMESSTSATRPELLVLLSEATLHKGYVDHALHLAQQALEEAQHSRNPEIVSMAWRVLGQTMATQADHFGAEACFAQAEQLARETQLEGERARILWAWAGYEYIHGDQAQGHARLQEARDIFIRLGFTTEVAQINATSMPPT